MEFVVSSSEMKKCDQYTIRNIGIPSLVLMERAAMSVMQEIERHAPDLGHTLIVCGSGNNGGDGFAVARLLDEAGCRVTLVFAGSESSMTEETAAQRRICERCGIRVETEIPRGRNYTVVVDALFGIGLSRRIEGKYYQLIHELNLMDAYRVAIDMPSGICADDGKEMGISFHADLTVTFAYRKTGQILFPGCESCGLVVRRDIGITADGLGTVQTPFICTEDDLSRIPSRVPYSNKGTYGKVLLIAGSRGMAGAAFLSASGAYRSGCGLVRIFTPECNRTILQERIPEAMVTSFDEDSAKPGTGRAENTLLEELLTESMNWADVVVLGPGLGRSRTSSLLLETVMKHWHGPLVIDADGLNLLSEKPLLMSRTQAKIILTPHVGEMSRLTGQQISEITDDLIDAACSLSRQHHIVCVLKDARTVITDGNRICLNTTGNSGMAVGGSGDVLSGVIGGLLAQNMSLFDAASLGVYIHGMAGDLASRELGSYGMLAGDIAVRIGEVLKTV